MKDYLSLSRAARLTGVTRSELQKRIRLGELATFEGEIAVNDLLRLYPDVSLEQSGDLERVERIKANALPRGQERESALPSAQVLISRLKSLSEVLVGKAEALEAAEGVLSELDARLTEMAESGDAHRAACTRDIQAWLALGRRRRQPTQRSHRVQFAPTTGRSCAHRPRRIRRGQTRRPFRSGHSRPARATPPPADGPQLRPWGPRLADQRSAAP